MSHIVDAANARITGGENFDYSDVKLMAGLVSEICTLQKQKAQLIDCLRQTKETYGGCFMPAFVRLEEDT